MSDGAFRKITYTVELLTDDDVIAFDQMSLDEINYQITEGHCVGVYHMTEAKPLTGPEMVQALYEFGSDPSFFQLDDAGNVVED